MTGGDDTRARATRATGTRKVRPTAGRFGTGRLRGPLRPHRSALRKRGIEPVLARRGRAARQRLGRWLVERALSWLHQNRRLKICYERRDELHEDIRETAVRPEMS